jgi:hypothetical protein
MAEAALEVAGDDEVLLLLLHAVSATAAAVTAVAPRILASLCMRRTLIHRAGARRAR